MKVIREEMPAHMTRRRCEVCPQPAVYMVFMLSRKPNKAAQITVNRSARRFFCREHGKEKGEA